MTVGSEANPSPKLLTGEEGTKQLVTVKHDGEKGLATYFEKEKGAAVLGEGGLPPNPVAYKNPDATKYNLLQDQAYSSE